MKVLEQMALFAHQRDEKNNVAIAERIAVNEDYAEVRQIINLLQEGNIALKNDCIKILYEVGERKPFLIDAYLPLFLNLLSSKNNRLQWGAMCAVFYCSKTQGKQVFKSLNDILKATKNGSVICRDYRVFTLIELASNKSNYKKIIPLLQAELYECPENQFPMYCEKSALLGKKFIASILMPVILKRIEQIKKESRQKRLHRIIKKHQVKK